MIHTPTVEESFQANMDEGLEDIEKYNSFGHYVVNEDHNAAREDHEADHELEEEEAEVNVEDDSHRNVEEIDGNAIGMGDDDELRDDDYDIPYGDDDYNEVVNEIQRQKNEREGRIDPCASRGRPYKKVDSNLVHSQIVLNDVSDADTEYAPSDELHSESDSDDEDIIRWPEFDVEKDYYDPSLETGMLFRDFAEFKLACRNWSVKHRFDIYFPYNDLKRCICECHSNKNNKDNDKCKFRLYAAPVNKGDPDDPTVQIKSSHLEHTCSKVFVNRHATAEWLAKKYLDQFRGDREWSVNGIIRCIQRDFAYTIVRSKAYKIREKALSWIYGEEKEQYYKLLSYKLDIEATNPGSTVVLWRELGVFKGYYVCLAPLKIGWKTGCRPIVCIDGCWLKGTYGGQLLTAVGIDPNDCIYPIAWGIVLTESTDTWMWFLENLSNDLDLHYGKDITFMSDRQKISRRRNGRREARNQSI
ncbi:uncharacterized protein [Euphorbia lathyris]|uniref:uncharacterized protein isoform X2 n=1 Tax=Euphorbia lathyris TaxID=212925 RepID=UPI0033135254